MRNLTEEEILSLTTLLKMEKNSLAVAQSIKGLISNDELKKQTESGILATEGRIKGIQQFVNENDILDNTEEVK
ncbi:MAG: hypothetical protein ACOC1O_04780 [bacterium]